MLTQSYINKVARLMDQIGELRPGFLQDSASSLEGSVVPCQSIGAKHSSREVASKNAMKSVRVEVVFETDESTGEVRAVQK